MKLQQGDYVTNLTEEQFDELREIENHEFKLRYSIVNRSIMYDGDVFLHSGKYGGENLSTKLPFEEFKQRAINTFKDGKEN